MVINKHYPLQIQTVEDSRSQQWKAMQTFSIFLSDLDRLGGIRCKQMHVFLHLSALRLTWSLHSDLPEKLTGSSNQTTMWKGPNRLETPTGLQAAKICYYREIYCLCYEFQKWILSQCLQIQRWMWACFFGAFTVRVFRICKIN